MKVFEASDRIDGVGMRAHGLQSKPSQRPIDFTAKLIKLKNISPGLALVLGVATLCSAAAGTAQALNFGSQQVNTQSAAQSITVRNPGSLFSITFTLTISDADFVSAGGNCAVGYPMSLGPNRSCTMSVAFLPRSVGAKTGNIYYKDLTSVSGYTSILATLTGTGSPAPACTYSISPTSQTFPAAGGTGSVAVTTGAGCAWTATSSSGIVLLSGASGKGSGTVTYRVPANTSESSRTLGLTIAGKSFSVTQAAACGYSISPASQTIVPAGGTGTVKVAAPTGCAWTASSAGTVTIVSGTSGNGNGTVGYSVPPNVSGAVRILTLTIAGNTFSITQAPQPAAPSVSFRTPASYAVPAAGPVVVGDFNRDNIPDLVMLTAANTFSYMQGNSDGTFRPPVSFSMASVTGAIGDDLVAGDFNRDGNLDVAVVHGTTTSNFNGWGNQVTILLGNGRGGFLEPGFAFTTGGSDVTVATGDFDEDGRPDLAIGSLDAGAVYIHLGNGDGTFVNTSIVATGAAYVSAGYRANVVYVADVNNDHHDDLIVANGSTNTLSVLLGTGKGTFGAPKLFNVGVFPQGVSVTDLNNDNIPDIITANAGGTVSVLLGTGGGNFTHLGDFAVGANAARIVAADFNKDEKMDIAVIAGSTLTVLTGDGTGKLSGRLDFQLTGNGFAVASEDFTADGLPDLAIPNTSGALQVLLNNTVQK